MTGHHLALQLMEQFAESTGVTGKAFPRRYLWTDAFAVCNFLGLYCETADDRYLHLAVDLVDQVHYVLGRHRPDDARSGWISGLADEEGTLHPTCGGLRIGKPLNERSKNEPSHQHLEWDQDGQYFHYLTKWVHALARMYDVTRDSRYLRWAIELAVVAHCRFTYEVSSHHPKRMVWKMSIDLSRPLVGSMGYHDPLDGLATFSDLRHRCDEREVDKSGLNEAIDDFTQMCHHLQWTTDDPLGIGGLLDAATRLTQLIVRNEAQQCELLTQLYRDALVSLQGITSLGLFQRPAQRSLAFREFGLSIGLHAIDRIACQFADNDHLAALIRPLLIYMPIAKEIETYWSQTLHQKYHTWMEHREINMVMLCTSLAPEGYLAF